MNAQNVVSRLEIHTFNTSRREIIHEEVGILFEAPKWVSRWEFFDLQLKVLICINSDLDKKRRKR